VLYVRHDSERSANGDPAPSRAARTTSWPILRAAELARGYLISARDLGAWEHLAEIADAGIHTLKVEGRKKKPEYVATVTHGYRGVSRPPGRGRLESAHTAEVQPLVRSLARLTGGDVRRAARGATT